MASPLRSRPTPALDGSIRIGADGRAGQGFEQRLGELPFGQDEAEQLQLGVRAQARGRRGDDRSGLELVETRAMPANNLMLLWRHR